MSAAQGAPAQPAAGDEAAYLQVELGDHAGPVRRIAVDAQRGVVVTGADDKTARTWSLDSGELQRVLRPPVGPLEVGRVYGVAMHPLQPWVAVGGTSAQRSERGGTHWIYLYDAVSGAPLRRFDARGGDVKRLLWSADGALLIAAYAGDHAVRAFDAQGNVVFEDRFGAGVYALARSPQGQLAAAALDGTLRVYDLAGGKLVQRAQRTTPGRNPVSLAFSPDGGTLVVGYFLPGKTPDLIAWESGTTQPLPAPSGMQSENLMAVAWSAHDGRVIAAGTHGYSARKVPLVFYDPAARRVSETRVVARLSVTDLAALADGRVAYAASDGAWGVSGARPVARAAQLLQLLRADDVRASADGSRLSWPLDGGGERVTFDLARRTLAQGEGGDLSGPRVRRGVFDAPTEWENLTTPRVNGARIALHDDEVSRAVALFAHGKDAALGTSRALYRIGPDGQVVWRVTTPTEVRAVLVTREDRLIVTALLDGTIRLWRSSDGAELLTLLVLREGKWVMW
ncbi:MAG TPA: hypothetical protein VFR86_00180, partial [Burkholderiaceae bacterium]|nr:hypothetical protein [Burkholderiaceae bacterium]